MPRKNARGAVMTPIAWSGMPAMLMPLESLMSQSSVDVRGVHLAPSGGARRSPIVPTSRAASADVTRDSLRQEGANPLLVVARSGGCCLEVALEVELLLEGVGPADRDRALGQRQRRGRAVGEAAADVLD